MDVISVPRPVYDAMVAHARDGFPNEVCGIVMGPPGEMREAHRAQNAASDPLYTYDIEGRDLLRLNELAEERNWEFVAIYHSHPPFAEVYPSATDIAKAFYPDAVYFILAIGQIDARFRERLRNREQRSALGTDLDAAKAMPPRLRAFRIVKEDPFAQTGHVVELDVRIA